MSLRLRLALIITVLLLLSLAATLSRAIVSAREQVSREVQSTARLSAELLGLLLADAEASPARLDQVLGRLTSLDDIRHLEVDLLPPADDSRPPLPPLRDDLPVPAWFARLVEPPPGQLLDEVHRYGGQRIQVRTTADDEIVEAWDQVRETLWIALTRLLVMNVVLYFLITHWFRPLSGVAAALEAIGRGDYSRRIPRMPLPELQDIALRINRLTAILGASRAENERLTRKSLQIQEQERRHLAQELHDAMGQSVSAIKAMAVSIRQRAGEQDPVVGESARKIEEASNVIYSSVRGMMSRLRPSVLDELGLEAALSQMADDWNGHHEEAFCRLSVEGRFDDLLEEQCIQVYRIVQEALTNIARHAQADRVEIILSGSEVISLFISDNGQGYDPERVEQGMGLSGMRERVRVLHGELLINAQPGQGVSIQIEFPRVSKRKGRRDARTPR